VERSRGKKGSRVDVAVGSRIRARRRALQLNQAVLADAVGVTFQQIQKYERGISRVSASMLVKIAASLQTTTSELVGESPANVARIAAYLEKPDALQLLRSYCDLKDPESRRLLVSLARALGKGGATRRLARRQVRPPLGSPKTNRTTRQAIQQ
jgi:transcriptional regulator with XRE-family HTH domain